MEEVGFTTDITNGWVNLPPNKNVIPHKLRMLEGYLNKLIVMYFCHTDQRARLKLELDRIAFSTACLVPHSKTDLCIT